MEERALPRRKPESVLLPPSSAWRDGESETMRVAPKLELVCHQGVGSKSQEAPDLCALVTSRNRVQLAQNAFVIAPYGQLLVTARGIVELACVRSEEHTSELQSPCNLVCRLLLEK